MERNFFRLASAGAMRQGLYFGLWWVAGFACVIGSFSSSLAALLAFFFFFAAPIAGGVLMARFQRDSGWGRRSVGQLYLYGVMLYFYASVWLAVAVYVYFAFIDDGFFFSSYLAYFERPEVEALLSSPGMQAQLEQMTGGVGLEALVDELAATSPAVFAASAINSNLLAGLFLALPTAWVVRYIRVTK